MLKVLGHRDVTGSLLYLLPAAAALIAGVASPEALLRIGLVLVGSLLLAKGVGTALPALLRSLATLERMRSGFVTLGRIVSCHLAWDSARQEMPYREFLENWVVKVSKSQMGKATGCFGMVFILIFVAPLALGMLIVALVLAAGALNIHLGEPLPADLDVPYLKKWLGMGLLSIAAILAFLRLSRKATVDAVVPYLESEARRLTMERGEPVSLKAPLPADYSGVELICKLEYSVMGEPCTATARARFSNRLDLAGVERILFNPQERNQVDLFAGLPDEARIDEFGRWGDVPALGSAAWLALTGTVAIVAIASLLGNVPALYAILKS
jgi:hypothetical protein